MGQVKATFDGGIVSEPELKEFASGSSVLEFAVYVNHRTKNRDSGEYEDTGDVSKIKVKVWSWSDSFETAKGLIKGDIVEIEGSLKEREWTSQSGSKGRALETDWIEDITLKFRKDGATAGAGAARGGGNGFDSAVPSGF